MELSLRTAGIAGLVAICALLGPGAGFAQGGANGPTAAPPAPAPASPATSPADAAAAKADPDCKTADVACAWSHCNPPGGQYQSYHACIVGACHVGAESCVGDLILDLNDPDRQKANGGS